jgi:hypothetical protein
MQIGIATQYKAYSRIRQLVMGWSRFQSEPG